MNDLEAKVGHGKLALERVTCNTNLNYAQSYEETLFKTFGSVINRTDQLYAPVEAKRGARASKIFCSVSVVAPL
jgi:hypothetical protein